MKVHPNSHKNPQRNTKSNKWHKATKIGQICQTMTITNKITKKKQKRARSATTGQPTKRSVILQTTNRHCQPRAGSRRPALSNKRKRARIAEKILKIVNKLDISCKKAISCESSARATRKEEKLYKVPVVIYRQKWEVVCQTRCQPKDTARQLMVRAKTKYANQTTFIRKNHLTSTGTLKNRIQTSIDKNPVKNQTNLKEGIFLILIIISPHE